MLGPIDVSTATRLLTLVRQVIEADKTKSTYPTINLYGDWCVHDKLDRKDAQRIPAEIENALRIELEEKPGHFDGNTMAQAVSPWKFGPELSVLLTSKRDVRADAGSRLIVGPEGFHLRAFIAPESQSTLRRAEAALLLQTAPSSSSASSNRAMERDSAPQISLKSRLENTAGRPCC